MPEARILADVLFKRDPYLVKHWRKVWGTETFRDNRGRVVGSTNVVIDHEPEFMPLEEQQERFAQAIAEQGLFEFLLRPAIREGEVSHSVVPITIANLDRDTETGEYQFPNYERVARLRRALEAQSGIPAATILNELASCLPATRGTRRITQSPQLKVPQPASQGSEPSPPERQSRTVTRQVRLS